MTTSRDRAKSEFVNDVQAAIALAQKTRFTAPARITILADLMQIQCLRADNTELLTFTLPQGLVSTVHDLAQQLEVQPALHATTEPDQVGVEFESADDQDEFVTLFQMLSLQGHRAYSTPDLYGGSTTIDKDLCGEILRFLHATVQELHANGWKNLK